ncbi:hypothetical protein E4U12_004628 [Claviceps purpurea]|nr:hypothetical protein E4U12_004628 [Claviceps purpurea]
MTNHDLAFRMLLDTVWSWEPSEDLKSTWLAVRVLEDGAKLVKRLQLQEQGESSAIFTASRAG